MLLTSKSLLNNVSLSMGFDRLGSSSVPEARGARGDAGGRGEPNDGDGDGSEEEEVAVGVASAFEKKGTSSR